VMGRPKTMCHGMSFLKSLVPKMNRPGNTLSLEGYIPVLICTIQCIYVMQNERDVSMQGHCASGKIHLGDLGSRKFVWGHFALGRPITPPD